MTIQLLNAHLYSLANETLSTILFKLTKKDLTVVSTVSKRIFNLSEYIWSFYKKREHLNFSWSSLYIPKIKKLKSIEMVSYHINNMVANLFTTFQSKEFIKLKIKSAFPQLFDKNGKLLKSAYHTLNENHTGNSILFSLLLSQNLVKKTNFHHYDLLKKAIDLEAPIAAYLAVKKFYFDEEHINCLYQLCKAAAKLGNYQGLELLLRCEKNHPEFLYRFSQYCENETYPPILYYKALLEENPFKADDLMDMAVKEYGEKIPVDYLEQAAHSKVEIERYSEAINYYEKVISFYPNLPPARTYDSLAYAQFKNGMTFEALESYKKAISIDPKSKPDIFYKIGFIYHELGNIEDSIKYYRSCIEAYGNQAPGYVYENIGLNYFEIHDYKNAILYFFKALEIYKEEAPLNVLFHLGKALIELKDYALALMAYLNAFILFEEKLPCVVFLEIGWLYIKKNHFLEAAYFYDIAIHIFKDMPADAWEKASHAHFKIHNIHKASDYCKKAIKKYGNDLSGDLLNHYSILLYELKQPIKAKKYYQKAIDAFKDNVPAFVYVNASMVEQKLGNFPKALEFCKMAIEEYKNKGKVPVECFVNIAYVYLNNNEIDKSLRYYRRALKLYGKKIPLPVMQQYVEIKQIQKALVRRNPTRQRLV